MQEESDKLFYSVEAGGVVWSRVLPLTRPQPILQPADLDGFKLLLVHVVDNANVCDIHSLPVDVKLTLLSFCALVSR